RAVSAVAQPVRRVRRLLVGRPMATGQLEETLLPKSLALPIFASDPLSSVAYATEAALVVLVGVSATAAHLVFPISIAIAILLALPTYLFVTSVGVLVVAGLVQFALGDLHRAVVPHQLPLGTGTITLFVLLRAFSSGSTALTGVEAIANGVNAFRHPQGKNA